MNGEDSKTSMNAKKHDPHQGSSKTTPSYFEGNQGLMERKLVTEESSKESNNLLSGTNHDCFFKTSFQLRKYNSSVPIRGASKSDSDGKMVISIAVLFLAINCFSTLVQCNGISFGRIEIIDDVVDHYQITGIKVYNQSTIYGGFKNKDVPTGDFTKKTILAKYDAVREEYKWMIEIDTGNVHLVPIFLPCCDERSVIVVFPNCTTDIPPFHTRLRGDDRPYSLMIKLNQLGVVVWSKTINATAASTGGVVTTDANIVCDGTEDIIYLLGPVNQTIPFDCGSYQQSISATNFISRFSHEGFCKWATLVKNSENSVASLVSSSTDVFVASVIYMTDYELILITRWESANGSFVSTSHFGANVNGTILVHGGTINEMNPGYLSLILSTQLSDNQCIVKLDIDVSSSGMVLGSNNTLCFQPERDIRSMDYSFQESIYITGSVVTHDTVAKEAFVAKWNMTRMSIDLLSVRNDVSAIGLQISVGKDGYISALGRSYASISQIIPDNRILSSSSTFNYFAEIVDHAPITCGGHSSYDPNVCSGRGQCVALETCLCSTGFNGSKCDESEATVVLDSDAIEGELFEDTWILDATISHVGYLPVKVNVLLIVEDLWRESQRIYNGSYTLQSSLQSIQWNVTGFVLTRQYLAQVTIQIDQTTNLISSEGIYVLAVGKPQIKPLAVIPKSGAMLIDHFLVSTNSSDSRDLVYNFGYFDGNNNRVFLSFSRPVPNLNITIPILGNVTLFVQAALQNGIYSESTTVVRVYQGEPSKVTNVLTEQANDLSQTNGTAFESQLTTYTNSLVTSIQVITSNQTSQLLNNLINIIQSKQDELSTEVQIETIKTITQQYNYLSESSTVQTSIIVMKSLQRNDSKISDSITVAHNLANVMISTNSSKIQRESFSSMVNVLTGRVRQNMTNGQTEEISLPNLETVISRLNSSSIDVNTTILVRQPSSSGANTSSKYVQIVVNAEALSGSGVTFVQGQVVMNPADQYPDECDTSEVSSTVSTALFTANQQQIQPVDSVTALTQSSLELPSISTLRNRTDDYQYVCKYLNRESTQWLEDSKVCQTETLSRGNKTNNNVVVQCVCSRSVSTTVSLDYVQSSETVENVDSCTNPCGCSLIERGAHSKGLKPYAIALIVLACLTLVILTVAIVAGLVISLKLLKSTKTKYELKKPVRTPTDDIERRFDTMYE